MRFANALVIGIATCIVAIHMLLGALGLHVPIPASFSWVIWIAVALIALHVVLSAVTSYQQMMDRENPPSVNKRNHLILKWGTGILLAAVVIAHIEHVLPGPVVMAVLAGVTAWHVCVGAKSLLTDLGLDKRRRDAVRIAVIVIAALAAIGALAAIV